MQNAPLSKAARRRRRKLGTTSSNQPPAFQGAVSTIDSVSQESRSKAEVPQTQQAPIAKLEEKLLEPQHSVVENLFEEENQQVVKSADNPEKSISQLVQNALEKYSIPESTSPTQKLAPPWRHPFVPKSASDKAFEIVRSCGYFFVVKLVADGPRVEYRVVENLKKMRAEVSPNLLVIGQIFCPDLWRGNGIWLNCLTTEAVAGSPEAIQKLVQGLVPKDYKGEIVAGPTQSYRTLTLEPLPPRRARWFPHFRLPKFPDPLALMQSKFFNPEQLFDRCHGHMHVGDSLGVTPLHLAVVGGDATFLQVVVDKAKADCKRQDGWKDFRGRTPLHYASFMDPAVLQILLSASPALGIDVASKDKWGHTALDIANNVLSTENATILASAQPKGTWSLQAVATELAGKTFHLVCATSSHPRQIPAYLASHPPEATPLLVSTLPLHGWFALSKLQASMPGVIDARMLLRSASALECWWGDLMNKAYGPALDNMLIPVWSQLPSYLAFEFDDQPDTDGCLLLASPPRTKKPHIADQKTFWKRLCSRTGNVLDKLKSQANVCVIGGMVLSCLVADDDDYKANYKHTDVDIYIVGLTEDAFKARVGEVVEQLYDASPKSTVLRTAHAITIVPPPGPKHGMPIVQIVLGAYHNLTHLLFTTDLDCTALGYYNGQVYATPRGRDALVRRRNLVRPEKYMVRGEWRTESRFVKYARRGFRLVDIGLKPSARLSGVPSEVRAQVIEGAHAVDSFFGMVRPCHQFAREKKCDFGADCRFLHSEPSAARPEPADDKLRKAAVETAISAIAQALHGARLLLALKPLPELQKLLAFDAPVLRPGLSFDQLLKLAKSQKQRLPNSREEYDQGWPRDENYMADGDDENRDPIPAPKKNPPVLPDTMLQDDGYGQATVRMMIVNPVAMKYSWDDSDNIAPTRKRKQDGSLRGIERSLGTAVEPLDLESDRFAVRSWYEGVSENMLVYPYCVTDEKDFRGVGDFRK